MRVAIILLSLVSLVHAQQQPMVPLTDWRAQLDYQLGKIPMSREAHGEVIKILQEWERVEQAKKLSEKKE